MKRLVLVLAAVAVLAAVPACAADPAPAADPALNTDEQKAIYALGRLVSNNLAVFNFTPAEVEILKSGLADGVLKKPSKVDLDAMKPKIQELAKSRAEAGAVTQKKAGKEFLDKAAANKGATKTASGMVIETVKEGTGPNPQPTDTVKVHYTGTLIDGTVFDSSVKRGTPAEFALNQVIPCWTEGLQKIKVGGKAKLCCPSELAYGDQGQGQIPPGATLAFEVELLEIVKK